MKGVNDFHFVDLEKVDYQGDQIAFGDERTCNNYSWMPDSNCEKKKWKRMLRRKIRKMSGLN